MCYDFENFNQLEISCQKQPPVKVINFKSSEWFFYE
jgi:hypothetical protein